MERFEKIVVLESEVRARLLEAELTARGIPHLLRSYHDSAYDGLFQNFKGWGRLDAPAEHREEILAILEGLDQSPPGA